MQGQPFERCRAVTLVTLIAAAFAVGACGGSDSSGSAASGSSTGSSTAAPADDNGDNAQATAKAAVEKGKQIPEFALDAKPFDASKAKGKTIFNVPVSSTIPYIAAVDKEMQKVAEQYGVKFVNYENQGSPTQWAAGIDQAINQGVDLITLESGTDPRLLIPQLKRAKEAGIPVLTLHLYQNGTKQPAEVTDLVTANVTVPYWESGRLSVNYAIAEDGCDGVKSTVIIKAPDVPPAEGIATAMKDELEKLCPGSKTTEFNIPTTEWGTKIRPETQSALTKDPNIKWVLPVFDSMSLGASAGIRAAGKTDQVRIATYNGTPDVLKLIEDGDIVAADMGENINWLAWANMDQAFRILADGPIIADGNENTPLRVFDDSNVAETGTPPTPNKGYGDAYVAGYQKLWGEQ